MGDPHLPFITQENTPEGDRLARITKMARADAAYLGIDRLSTFLSFNIGGDAQLRELFTAAGCGGLLDFADQIRSRADMPTQSADHIHRYLEHLFRSGVLMIAKKVPSGSRSW